MSGVEAFIHLCHRALVPAYGRRFAALAQTSKGQRKTLKALYHQFGMGINPDSVAHPSYERIWEKPCLVYAEPLGFAVERPTVKDAYDEVAGFDGWLVLLRDGSAGIYRPEARWDAEVLLRA